MKKIVGLMIVLVMFTSMVYAGGWYPGASDWAIEELENASQNGIDNGYQNYSYNITRAQFAELIMNMYNQMTGKYPNPAPSDTFTDTTDKNVFMANAVGIINGKGNGIFAPQASITRQEMAIMMSRALDSMEIEYNKSDGVLSVADKSSVAGWAVSGVDFAFENGFMKGDGTNFKPLDNTPIEQAVIIVNRVFEKYHKSAEPTDYTKGYKVSIENGNGYITYSNGEKVLVRENVVYVDYLKSNNKNLYILTADKNSFRYDVSDMSYDKMPLTTYTLDMRVVQGGKYDGYVVVKTLIDGVTEYRVLSNNQYNSYQGAIINSFDNMNEQISAFYNKGFEYTVDGTKYDTYQFTCKDEQKREFTYQDKSYIELSRASKQSTPFILVTDEKGTRQRFNGYGGTYSVDIYNGADSTFSGGIFFNTTSFNYMQDFTGFRVVLVNNGTTGTATAMLIKNDESKEEVIVTNENVNIDTTKYGYNKLMLQKNGDTVDFYINGTLAFTSTSEKFNTDDGYFGLFCEDGKTTFTNFVIEKLPY